MKFPAIFHRKHVVTFHLKSGAEITTRCREFSIKAPGNELSSYSITGGEGKLFYVRIDDISAITLK